MKLFIPISVPALFFDFFHVRIKKLVEFFLGCIQKEIVSNLNFKELGRVTERFVLIRQQGGSKGTHFCKRVSVHRT